MNTRIAVLESTVVQQQKEIDSLNSAFRQLTSDASLASSPGSLAESFADISIISPALPLPDIFGSTRSRSKQDNQSSKSVATQPSKGLQLPHKKRTHACDFIYPQHLPATVSRYRHGRAITSRSTTRPTRRRSPKSRSIEETSEQT
ncbi:hypothetical protein SNEBB_007297 [Seison nebaliae]|nr:hypothetical protein SNEBB_007297 [Seison nebaliae]